MEVVSRSVDHGNIKGYLWRSLLKFTCFGIQASRSDETFQRGEDEVVSRKAEYNGIQDRQPVNQADGHVGNEAVSDETVEKRSSATTVEALNGLRRSARLRSSTIVNMYLDF